VARHLTVVVGLLASLILSATASSPQGPPAASGHWEGAIQVPGQALQVAVDLAQQGGTWRGEISIPAQGAKGAPLEGVAVTGGRVTFAIKGVPGSPTFAGTLSTDGTAIDGDFTQAGNSVPFKLARTGEAVFQPVAKSTPITETLAGTWEGALDVGGRTLRLVFKLARQPDGTGGGTLISVDQGGAEIPIATVVQKGPDVRLLVPAVGGSFEGQMKGGELSGTWSQGGGRLPLVLKRTP
jgi:hypothetical protein